MIKFFADTASLKDIEYCFSRGVNDGITTNPMILKDTGDLSQGMEGACRIILGKYSGVPVSLETDLRGINVHKLDQVSSKKIKDVLLEQAKELASYGPNVVVKIPVCQGGLEAARYLVDQGVRTNITACMTPYQALTAVSAGIGYVSLFANRMLDSHILELSGHSLEKTLKDPHWKDIVKSKKDRHFEEAWTKTLGQIAYVAQQLDSNPHVGLIVGSIRSPADIHRLVRAAPQIITIPTKIVEGLVEEGYSINDLKATARTISDFSDIAIGDSLSHPMTQYTLLEFEMAADVYRSKL